MGAASVDLCEARIPATRIIELGQGFVPTGRILSARDAGVDFTEGRQIGPTRFNHCFSGIRRDADGLARSWLRNPATRLCVTVAMDRTFDYIVAYTGDAIGRPYARTSLAIEPMTCATNAFNRHELGLRALESGRELTGQYGVSAAIGGP